MIGGGKRWETRSSESCAGVLHWRIPRKMNIKNILRITSNDIIERVPEQSRNPFKNMFWDLGESLPSWHYIHLFTKKFREHVER